LRAGESIGDTAAMSVDIRRITPDDGPDLRAVRLAALADTPSAFGSTFAEEAARSDTGWSERALWASAGVERITLLARQEDRVVGIAGGYREEIGSTEVHLVSVWTAPEARRSGLGQLLVGAVIDWAVETGASSAGLWVTRGNTPAQLLYESMGFRETGEYQPLPSDPCADETRMILHLDRGSPPAPR
jgi:ribosomal protein S18 acetylase RimI-like enzyme